MKKILTLSLLAVASFGFAQSFQITVDNKDVSGKSLTKEISTDSAIYIHFSIKNKSALDKNYRITRTLDSPAKVGKNYLIYFFTGSVMYLPSDSIVFISEINNIKAGEVLPAIGDSSHYGILANFQAGPGVCEDHVVSYKMWDVSDPSDFAEVTINYTCATGIKEYGLGTISPAYPNPANGLITIDYTLKNTPKNAKIIFYDMLGKVVKETPIANQQGVAKINVADLHTGFYFYNFMVDGKTSNARKIIISGN
jgi:hypothetical protein